MSYIDQLWSLLDVLIAAVLGGVIGFERESKGKPAGLRTNMVIAASAAIIVMLSRQLLVDFDLHFTRDVIKADPVRIIQSIVIGVSFIGAGTVIKSESKEAVKYLTTAATILLSACLGICVGMKLYVFAVGVALLGLVINYVFRWIYRKYKHRNDKD
ncbi:MAG: MgtC/SapB family protein [Crocinitomicaceae bacterium]|nr:MgtC/SapB family protein [Crocinitomicaceae bacterium]